MNKSYIFKVVVEKDKFESGKKAFHAFCPALKGCHTWGHTYDEALSNIKEVVEIYLEDLKSSGEPIPETSDEGVLIWSTPAVVVNQ